MRKDEYIASAVSKISNRKAKRETERELAEHIDELTEFYLDRNMTADEAEQRAVADMGEPETVCDSLGRLHRGAGKVIFTILLCSLTVFGVLEYFGYVSINSSSVGIVWQSLADITYNSPLLFSVFRIHVYVIMIVLAIAGYHKHKIFLEILLAAEFFLTAKAMLETSLGYGYIYPLFMSLLPNLILFALTLVLLIILDREDDLLSGIRENGKTVKRVAIVLGIFVFLSGYTLLSVFIGLPLSDENEPKMTFEEYKEYLHLPTAVADEEAVGEIDVNSYTDTAHKGNGFWYFDYTRIKPEKLLPERYNSPSVSYYIWQDNTDYIYKVEYNEDSGAGSTDWYISESFDYPDFTEGELTKIAVGLDRGNPVDITDLLQGDELTVARSYADIGTSAQHIPLCDNAYHKPIFWYFKGADGLYLDQGDLYINEKNECFISPYVSHLDDYYGTSCWVSNGPMFKLSDEVSESIVMRIKNADNVSFY